ncbi:MAG: aminoacyl-tRNA hydrolase [bacterium]
MRLIIGLGNPGEKYTNTRHNSGFIILDKIALARGLVWKFNKKFNAEICEDGEIIFMKGATFMNDSGQAVRAIMDYYKLIPKKLGLIAKKESDLSQILTVIHDDLDIEFGKIKESINSGSAGHRGVGSIIAHLKTKNFRRLRIGIKTDNQKNIPADKYVLQKFNKEELGVIDSLEVKLS